MTLRERVLQLLESEGPMTTAELAELVGTTNKRMAACVSVLRHELHQVYITAWRRDTVRGDERPRAVFRKGRGRDAKPIGPKSNTDHCRNYRHKRRVMVSSIFQLGTPAKQRSLPA